MPFRVNAAEITQVNLQFALLLRDGFSQSDELLGDVTVSCGAIEGRRKDSSGAFLFFGLKPGPLVFTVASDPYTPYYLPTQIATNVPMPSALWPAFPDQTVANPNLPLGDAGQTAAYKAQRQQASLLPAAQYPFPGGATLIRGTVRHGGAPLSAATVQQAGGIDVPYTTGADGQFVLFVTQPLSLPQPITVNAKHAGLADGNVNVTVLRGQSVSMSIDL
jgi:hypothetical protein